MRWVARGTVLQLVVGRSATEVVLVRESGLLRERQDFADRPMTSAADRNIISSRAAAATTLR